MAPERRWRITAAACSGLLATAACGGSAPERTAPPAAEADPTAATDPGAATEPGAVTDPGPVTESGAVADPGAAAGPAAAAEPGGVIVERGVEYGRGLVRTPAEAEAPLLLDLYRPAGDGEGDRPVVILIHGGGFTGQSRTDPGIVDMARGLAERGIVAASIDYRLAGQDPVPSARVATLGDALPAGGISPAMVAAVDDTLTAAGYLADHAAGLGIDPDRLGLVGSSAGAITADHVGYVLDDHGIDGPAVAFVGSLWGGIFVPPRADVRQPGAEQLEAGEPALFAVHGDADDVVPVRLDDELVARARAAGVPSEYHRIPGGGHGYRASGFSTGPVDGDQTAYDRLLAFAEQALAGA